MASPIDAARAGDVDKVMTLLQQGKYPVDYSDSNGHTPLHDACQNGHLNVVRVLVSEFEANVNIQDRYDFTPLHYACEEGSIDVTRALVSEFKADLSIRSAFGLTPLMVAARNGHKDVVLALLRDYQCPVTDRDDDSWGVLHHACVGGSVGIVETLLHVNNINVNALNNDEETPLLVALKYQAIDVALLLISKSGCDPNVKNSWGQTPLHYACEGGEVELVQTLINDHKADINALNTENEIPLAVALKHQKFDVVFCLISKFGCDPNVVDSQGKTLLHYACECGDVDLVQALVCEHKADVNAYSWRVGTPLHVAFRAKKNEVFLSLMSAPSCDSYMKDQDGQTVLHLACKMGSIDLVNSLLNTHKMDVNALNERKETLLHVAVASNQYEVALALVKEHGCDPSARGHLRRTALHVAAYLGHHKIVNELLKFTSPLVVDIYNNTPLHLASQNSLVSTTQCLLHDNAPVLVRNVKGYTPRDLARGECGKILEEYIQVNRKQLRDHYSTILELAEKKYSGSHWITRIFVVGNPGAGKSSFIESLKREGFIESFSKVSESSVPPHTAGIIPSVHMSSQYGRVLFYDFAGDVEYYSSHAAIFESLASSRKGDNIFIVVVDLREDSVTIKTTLHYWFSFIQYQRFSRSSFIVVGGHLDQCVEQSECLKEFCTAMQPNVYNIKHFMLDCRDPRSSQTAQVKRQIFTLVNESQKFDLSKEARLLLGLLEKDFSAVTACPVQTLVSHIKASGGWLPIEPKPLHQILLELHEVGVLLLLGDCTKDTDHVILNISKLTNEAHKILFATFAFSNIQGTQNFNIGILPDSILNDVLPPYITKECLTQLQFCQEIRHTDVGLFPSIRQNSTSQSFLFFPALCSVDKGELPWDESIGHSFSIRWLALCTDVHDYFPPRFLHVLLLRLVHRFTLSVPAQLQTAHASPEHSRRCTMWKKGVYWKMEEGVDCMVELVKGNKGVVVFSKSSLDGAEDCVKVFTKVVSCVMETKAEFCHSTKPKFFLLDSNAEADYLNEDHQFAMSDVEKALKDPEGKRVVISVLGRREMDLSNLQWMRTLSYWNIFFPITVHEVLHALEEVVDKIFELGLSLGASWAFLESLRADFPSDISQRRIGLVSWWMKSSSTPPCWYTLSKALIDIERQVLADKVQDKHGLHIQLQEKLLSKKTEAEKPDEEFLHSLSGVVGPMWPSLAVSLALTEGLKEKVGLSQQELALQMLKIWASREEATYGQLYHQLKTISLFQYSS